MMEKISALFKKYKEGYKKEDIKAIIDLIKEKVKEKYNIDLKVEQEFVNFKDWLNE